MMLDDYYAYFRYYATVYFTHIAILMIIHDFDAADGAICAMPMMMMLLLFFFFFFFFSMITLMSLPCFLHDVARCRKTRTRGDAFMAMMRCYWRWCLLLFWCQLLIYFRRRLFSPDTLMMRPCSMILLRCDMMLPMPLCLMFRCRAICYMLPSMPMPLSDFRLCWFCRLFTLRYVDAAAIFRCPFATIVADLLLRDDIAPRRRCLRLTFDVCFFLIFRYVSPPFDAVDDFSWLRDDD